MDTLDIQGDNRNSEIREQVRQRYSQSALRVAAGLWPSSGLIHYHLGLAYHALGDQAGVSSICSALIIIDPDMARRLADDTTQE